MTGTDRHLAAHRRGSSDDERPYVAYGRWAGDSYLDRRTTLPEAPTINRITPAGGSWFSPDGATAHLSRDDLLDTQLLIS